MNHSTAARIYVVALAALAIVAVQAGDVSASDRCFTGESATNGATGAGDLAEIEAVRAAVDAACACDGFPRRRAYERCTRQTLIEVRDGGAVRRECLGHLRGIFKRSSCSRRARRHGERVPCLKTRAAGEVSCSIRPLERCEGEPSKSACTAFDFCMDAADTNGDLRLGASDSGECCGEYDGLVIDSVSSFPPVFRRGSEFAVRISWTLADPVESLHLVGSVFTPLGGVIDFDRTLTNVAAGSHTEDFPMVSAPSPPFVNGGYRIDAVVNARCTSVADSGTFQVQ